MAGPFLLIGLVWVAAWVAAALAFGSMLLYATLGSDAIVFGERTLHTCIDLGVIDVRKELHLDGIEEIRHVDPPTAGRRLVLGAHVLIKQKGTDLRLGLFMDASQANEVIGRIAAFAESQGVMVQKTVDDAAEEPDRHGCLHSPFGLYLNVVNLIPIYGVIFLDWGLEEIMFLFLAETVIIGLCNAVKGAMVWGRSDLRKVISTTVGLGVLLFIYGGSISVFFILPAFPDALPGEIISSLISTLWPLLLLYLASHGSEVYTKFMAKGIHKNPDAARSHISNSFGCRVFLLHILLVFGGFLVFVFKGEIQLLVLLTSLKFAAEGGFSSEELAPLTSETPT